MTREREHPRRRFLAWLGTGAAGLVAGGATGRRLLDAGERPVPATTADERSRGAGTRRQPPGGTGDPPEPPEPPEPEADSAQAPAEPPAPYEPAPGEVFAEAKLVAARVVEALTNYAPGGEGAAVGHAAQHGAAGLEAGAITSAAGALLVPDTGSVGRVVYPQLGGLAPHRAPVRAAVMVVVDQRLSSGTTASAVSRCIDVRLRHEAGTWRLEGIAPVAGPPVPRGETSAAAARVLDDPRIELPDTARWDIHEGLVTEPVLEELALLSARAPVAVTSFLRGHPEHVFGTDRRSGHMSGLAVDVWAVGGVPVVLQQPATTTLVHEVARAMHDSGRVGNLGSPWAFDERGGRSFTDPVHHDHLHLGFLA
jgi:hypothetical protein